MTPNRPNERSARNPLIASKTAEILSPAELHLHLYGCIRSADLLRYLANCDRVEWDWYNAEMQAAYGAIPPTRELVERFRAGDNSVAAAFEEIFVFADADAGNFNRFQAKANLLWAGTNYEPDQLEHDVLQFAAGIRADLIGQGIKYAEYRAFPISALLASFADESRSLTERLAISLNRKDPWKGWEQVQKLALGPHGTALTGVDFSGIEQGHPPKDMAAFFGEVRSFNNAHPERAIALLYHVGESFGDKSLESAIRWVQEAAELGAHRLGHAIALGIDPEMFGLHTRHESVAERKDQIAYDLHHHDGLRALGVSVDSDTLHRELSVLTSCAKDNPIAIHYDHARLTEIRLRQEFAMKHVRSTGAVIEVCPTSNRRVANIKNSAHHPFHRFLKAGLPTIVSSDDPGIFGTTLAQELDWVCQHTGGGNELRRHLIETAWNSRSEVLTGRVAISRPPDFQAPLLS